MRGFMKVDGEDEEARHSEARQSPAIHIIILVGKPALFVLGYNVSIPHILGHILMPNMGFDLRLLKSMSRLLDPVTR
jgi:hypothetical protein